MKRRNNKTNIKSIWHYLKIYFLSLFLASLIFTVGSLFNPQYDCANSATCESDLLVSVDNDAIGMFQGRKITPPKVDLAMATAATSVLGVHVSNEKKHIYVDLSKQTLYTYEGNKEIMRALISTGKWGRTPTGNFNIWIKLPVTRMAGGQGADYYNLPNVQWVMYFHNDFGLHAAYWHNNFGHPMSHGCINMRLIDARKLFAWADGPISDQKGTAVSVCDQFKEPARNASASVAGGPGTCIQDNPIN